MNELLWPLMNLRVISNFKVGKRNKSTDNCVFLGSFIIHVTEFDITWLTYDTHIHTRTYFCNLTLISVLFAVQLESSSSHCER